MLGGYILDYLKKINMYNSTTLFIVVPLMVFILPIYTTKLYAKHQASKLNESGEIIYCPVCGYEVDEGTHICQECGAVIEDIKPE